MTNYGNFVELCSQIDSSKELRSFFDLFLTFEEKEIFGARFAIIAALLEGKLTQREIADKYKVSIAQITRGSNALKLASIPLKNFLKSWRPRATS